MPRPIVLSCVLWLGCQSLQAAEVSGRVEMPETCSPAVSPAVVVLEPRDGKAPATSPDRADLALVRQKGLLFIPRVQAMTLGQTLTFTNDDSETHSVHNVGAGVNFDWLMTAGQKLEVVPQTAGVLKIVCDIHSHMRGFVVVAASPWVAVCASDGRFRLAGVPEGRYRLRVWHEMGPPLIKRVDIQGAAVDLGVLTVTSPSIPPGVLASATARRWPEVIDRIALTLSASLEAAHQPNGAQRARRLAEQAYFGEFDSSDSDMETAVRRYLGLARTTELEAQFRALIGEVRRVAAGQTSSAQASERLEKLLRELARASEELNRLGIVDASKIDHAPASALTPTRRQVNRQELLMGLDRAFDEVRAQADSGRADEAAAALTDAYFTAFEPLERELELSSPLLVPRLEARFNALRGEIGSGLKGEDLAASLNDLRSQTAAGLERVESVPVGAFGAAFGVSLITILREGVEVILLLTMLIAVVARTEQPRNMAAIRWGIGLAVAASLATAAALNLLLASTAGRSRELLEGLVMLAAAAVLFYVSYWLISRSEASRWTNFLKQQVQHGAALGSSWTLGLTAFLAVYREGAETALMYQALFGSQPARLGQAGLAAGLGAGLLILAGVYSIVRRASVRLPIRTFFKLSSLVLFGMAVVFAGKGIFELQTTGLIRVTTLPWLGTGLPILGLYPNVQVVSVQVLLLTGAAVALVMLMVGDERPAPADRVSSSGSQVGSSSQVSAGV